MHANHRQTLATLNRLADLNRQSERGFETAAEHVKNRGMKILLKTYAHQRANFAQALDAEISRLTQSSHSNGVALAQLWRFPTKIRRFLAAIHRGWIDIKAAMTIGRENTERVVLNESKRAESGIALYEYRQALEMNLPTIVKTELQSHYQQIQDVHQQLRQMAGDANGRLLVQLFDHSSDAQQATDDLRQMGFDNEQIRTTELWREMDGYECNCHGSRIMESASGGAIVGLVLGVILGIIAGASALFEPSMDMLNITATTTLVGAGFGLLCGSLFGILIGQGVLEDDAYLYDASLQQGNILVMVEAANDQIAEARTILRSRRLQPQGQAVAVGG